MVKKSAVYSLALTYLLTGCATGGSDSATQASSDNPEQACNPVIISIIAGLGCAALISKDKNRVRNGLVCAAAGYVGCMVANSYKAEQVKTAKEVENDYLRQQRKLPAQATLASYKTEVNPHGAVSKGQKVNVSSNIVVIPGRNNSNVKIEEEVAIVDSVGDQWGNVARKQANPNGEAGQYRTSFTVPVRQEMSQGIYTVHKSLYLDGVKTRSDDKSKFQIVVIDNEMRMASIR